MCSTRHRSSKRWWPSPSEAGPAGAPSRSPSTAEGGIAMEQSRAVGADWAAEWGLTSFDPWDPRITSATVWDMYRAMRQAGPALHSDAHGGFWSIARYDDVRAAAADPATFSSAQGVVVGRKKQVPSIPLEFDRPEHTAYRKALSAPFLRSRVERFSDLVRSEVDELLDRVADARQFDVVRDIAAPLPLKIISEFLGITGDRQVLHQQLGHDFVHADISTVAAAEEAYYGFMREEVRARGARLGEDFISVLVQMDDDDVRRRYLQGRDSAPQVVEEALRIDPPIHLEARTTTSAVDVGGVTIPAGEKVALLYASGNHDDVAYPDPERFDAARQGPPNLTFGHGVHKCLGQHLSVLEMTVVLEEVLARFPDYQLTAEPVGAVMVYGHHMAWQSIPAAVFARASAG